MIYGRAGTGLADSKSWAANETVARGGADAEKRTEKLLNALESRAQQLAVFHDIVVPNPRGFKYNIDHAVLSGNTLQLIDTKWWRPGFLWTVGGRTRNGFKDFPYADKKSVQMAWDDMRKAFPGVDLPVPLVVVWPSSQGNVTMWAASMPGGVLVKPDQLKRKISRLREPADLSVVARMLPLLAR